MQPTSNFFNFVATLVIVAFSVWFVATISDMDAKWTTRKRTEKQSSQKKLKLQKQGDCKHSYYDMASKQPLIETEDFLFAFHFMDLDIMHDFKKINEDKDIQKRSLPNNNQMKHVSRYYCPQCQHMEVFRLEDICKMAIDARDAIEEEDAKRTIEKKWLEIQREKQAIPKKGSWP